MSILIPNFCAFHIICVSNILSGYLGVFGRLERISVWQLENELGAVMEIASGKCADQFFQKVDQQKAFFFLIFSAILAKRGNLLIFMATKLKKKCGFDVASSFIFIFDVV